MSDQVEPPCWGEVGAPLLPSSWRSGIPDSPLGIPPRRPYGSQRAKAQPLTVHSLCTKSDWSNYEWPTTPLEVALDVLTTHLDTDQASSFMDTPLLPGRLHHPQPVSNFPLLVESWKTLEATFTSPEGIAEVFGTATALELLQLTGCAQTTLDVAITLPSWTVTRTIGFVVDEDILQPQLPDRIDEAFRLAGLRHLRTACLSPRHADINSDWPTALAGRAGATIDGKLTLEQAGNIVGVTRERLRQVVKRYPLDHPYRRRWPLSPQLESINSIVEAAIGVELATLESELKSCGTGADALDLASALRLLAWYGQKMEGEFEVGAAGYVHSSASALGLPKDLSLEDVRNMVWELSEGTGFLREQDLVRALGDRVPDINEGLLPQLLDSAIGRDRLPLGYLFVVKHSDPAVLGVFNRTLSWVNPLHLNDLYESLTRRFRFRGFPVPPPIEVIRALLERLDGFTVDDDQVLCTLPEDRDTDTILAWIGNQLLGAEDHVIHRSALLEACRNEGMNTTSVGIYLQFGEIVRPVGRGCFALVGSSPSSAAINRARERALRATVKGSRSVKYVEGGARLDITVGNALRDSGVLVIPSRVQRLVADRRLSVNSELGTHGHLALSGNVLFGFTSVLNALEVMPGDEISVFLDLLANSADVTLRSEEDG